MLQDLCFDPPNARSVEEALHFGISMMSKEEHHVEDNDHLLTGRMKADLFLSVTAPTVL